MIENDSGIFDPAVHITALKRDIESLAAMIACLIEDRGGPAFIERSRFNDTLRNRTVIIEECDDSSGFTIRAMAR